MTTEYTQQSCLKTSDYLIRSTGLLDPGSSISSDPDDPVCMELLLDENDGHGVVNVAMERLLRVRIRILRQNGPKPPRIHMNAAIQFVIAIVPGSFQIIKVHASIPYSKDRSSVVGASA